MIDFFEKTKDSTNQTIESIVFETLYQYYRDQ